MFGYRTILLFFAFALCMQAQWIQDSRFPSTAVWRIKQTSSAVWACTYNKGVYRSVDGMQTWSQILTGLSQYPAYSVKDLVEVENQIFIATGDGIYKLSTDGLSWIKKSNGMPVGGGATYLFSESIFYTAGRLITGAFNGIYYSTDMGENWNVTNITGQHVWAKNLTYHGGKLFAARETNNTPVGFTSTDSGLTWTPLTGLNMPVINFYSEPGKLWAGTIHGAWLSVNNGLSWTNLVNGLSADPYNSSFLRWNGILFSTVTAGGSGMFATVNDGLNWIDIGSKDGLPFLSDVHNVSQNDSNLYISTTSGIYKRLLSDFRRDIQVSEGWNIIANPLLTVNKKATEIFPQANSGLFAYENGYVQTDSLMPGKSYWLRFPANATIALYGIPDSVKSTTVKTGWNLVAAKGYDIPVGSITSQPNGILNSSFFGFNSGYNSVNLLQTGKGYWIKSSQNGKLVWP